MSQSAATAPLRWFGSSGIRGPLEKVDVDLALRLGRALGERYQDIVLGHDARLSGPALSAAFAAGAMASGAAVTRVGLLPTPALAHEARHYDLGVQVTASHNPAPDNGFKLWTPEGSALPETALHDIEQAMANPPSEQDWTGTGSQHDDNDVARRYLEAILANIGTDALAGMRIAVDTGHGAGAVVTPALLTRLGAKVRVLGGNPDGRFPDRPSEPTDENLAGLRRLVAEGDYDLGLAHDGDADRTVVVGPDGTTMDCVRLFTVMTELRGDERVALPVDASGVFADHLPDVGVDITPVGDIHLSRAIDAGATAACEPSGTWFLSEWSPTPEGPFAAAYIALLAAQHKDLFARVSALPKYCRMTKKMVFPTGMSRHDATPRLADAGARLVDTFASAQISNVDGTRLQTDDGWILVRPSGTEPVARITTEARTKDRAETLLAAANKACADALGVDA